MMTRSSSRFHWHSLAHLGLDLGLIAMLTTYVVHGPFQTYPPPGWVDPGFYQGYFVNFMEMIERFGPTYHSNRFVFMFLGQGLNALLPPSEAHIALFVILHVLALLFLRMLLRPAVGRLPTLVAMVVFGLSPLTVAATTRGYVDGVVVVFILGAIAFFFKGLRANSGISAFLLSGVFSSLAFYTHPSSILTLTVAFSIAALVYPTVFAIRVRALAAAWLYAFLLVTSAYGLVSFAVSGDPDFITRAGKVIERVLVKQSFTNFRIDLSEWIFGVTRFWIMVFTGILCLGMQTGLRHLNPARSVDDRDYFFRWASLTLIGTLIVIVSLDVGGLTAIIQHSFYSVYFSLTFYIAFASLLSVLLRDAGKAGRAVLFPATMLIMAAGPYLLLEAGEILDPDSRIYVYLLAAGLLLCTAPLAAASYFGRAVVKPAFGVALPGLLVVIVPVFLIVNSDTRHIYRSPDFDFAAAYRVAHEAFLFIDPKIEGRDVYFWFNRDRYNREVNEPNPWHVPMHGIYPLTFRGRRYELNLLDTVNAFYLWDKSRLNDHFPALDERDIQRLLNYKGLASIVLLSHDPGDILRAQAALSEAGLDAQVQDSRQISSGLIDLHVWVIDLL